VDIPATPYYAPSPPADSFHAFFGLVPPKVKHAARVAGSTIDPIEALQRENTAYVASKLKTAEALFAKATAPGVENREQLLGRAQRVLTAVVRLNPEAHEARLLLVNTALMRQHLMEALCYLQQLVANRPTIFVEEPNVARYFGDYQAAGTGDTTAGRSREFEKLMRDHLRVGENNPAMPEMYAIQAYCAWGLNDRVRLRQALDRIKNTSFASETSEKMMRVRYALAAALRR